MQTERQPSESNVFSVTGVGTPCDQFCVKKDQGFMDRVRLVVCECLPLVMIPPRPPTCLILKGCGYGL